MSTSQADIALTLPPEVPTQLLRAPAFRTTLGVLVDLVANARRHVILAAPFIQLTEVMCAGTLGAALDAALMRGVRIDFVGTSGSLRELAQPLLTRREPRHCRVSLPAPNVNDARAMGSHAKLCLVDSTAAYLGSANLTEKGLSTHLEVGVLLRGESASALWEFVEQMYEIDFFLIQGWLPWPDLDTNRA